MESAAKRVPAKRFLDKVRKLMMDPITRPIAFKKVSQDCHVSINALRVAAYREGLTEDDQSLKFAFPVPYEKALVTVCILYARQGTPLTKHDFALLATKLAGRKDDDIFSDEFVDDFVERHKEHICEKPGKILSPTRCYSSMLRKTQEFVSGLDSLFASNTINQNNLVVFDETVIGDSESLPIVIGEKIYSGGGNISVVRTREAMLCSYIPFSLADGSTPFRVTICKRDKRTKDESTLTAVIPEKEKGLRSAPHRLLLLSDTGFVTLDLFKHIMDEFTKWWTTTRPGLHCFLICDNLRAHVNYEIVNNALINGIHIFTIMSGSSNWFQVHDQFPFANLKNRMRELKNEVLASSDFTSQQRRMLLTAAFYDAEYYAFQPRFVLSSFEQVGLFPWDKDIIFRACKEHSPADPKTTTDPVMERLINVIQIRREERIDMACKMLSGLKTVVVPSPQPPKKIKKRTSPDKSLPASCKKQKQKRPVIRPRKDKDTLLQPHTKRGRKMQTVEKRRCSKRAQKSQKSKKKC